MSETSETPDTENDLERTEDVEFREQIDALVRDAEDMRMSFMKRHRTREHITMTIGIISVIIGAAGFGWFFLVKFALVEALACMVLAILIPLIMQSWSASILKVYRRRYKQEFLPRLAEALGGFKFHPARGIGRKIISKTGLIPRHDIYEAEDCFMGKYKGVKVLFSEARLRHKAKGQPAIFDGVFVLLEIPNAVIEGHTILTADQKMIAKWRGSRWKKLKDVKIASDRFEVFSDAPEAAQLLIGERLLKELSEAADIFDDAALSAAFFRGKYVFLMIPYAGDMFEPSSIHIPVATKQHAMQCKREIEQILEIIDVFDLYKPAEKSV